MFFNEKTTSYNITPKI
eukprot:UN19753